MQAVRCAAIDLPLKPRLPFKSSSAAQHVILNSGQTKDNLYKIYHVRLLTRPPATMSLNRLIHNANASNCFAAFKQMLQPHIWMQPANLRLEGTAFE